MAPTSWRANDRSVSSQEVFTISDSDEEEEVEFIPSKSNLSLDDVSRKDSLPLSPVVISTESMNLLDLPTEMIQKILSHLDFKTVANLRLVNRQMDEVCGSLLTSNFNKLQKYLKSRCASLKAQMPRRQSARELHQLYREFSAIKSLRWKLPLNFNEYIKRNLMCYFPGEILDEAYRILHRFKLDPKKSRDPYEEFQEFREFDDLVTMAEEYFNEKLKPYLKDPWRVTSPQKRKWKSDGDILKDVPKLQKMEESLASLNSLLDEELAASKSLVVLPANKYNVTIGEDQEATVRIKPTHVKADSEIMITIKGTRTPEKIETAKRLFSHLMDMDLSSTSSCNYGVGRSFNVVSEPDLKRSNPKPRSGGFRPVQNLNIDSTRGSGQLQTGPSDWWRHCSSWAGTDER